MGDAGSGGSAKSLSFRGWFPPGELTGDNGQRAGRLPEGRVATRAPHLTTRISEQKANACRGPSFCKRTKMSFPRSNSYRTSYKSDRLVAEGALLLESLRSDPGKRASGRRQPTSEGVGLRRSLRLPAPREPLLPAARPARISGLAPPPAIRLARISGVAPPTGYRYNGAVRGCCLWKLSALASGVALRRLHHPGIPQGHKRCGIRL